MMSGKAKWTLATGFAGSRASRGRPIRQRLSPQGRHAARPLPTLSDDLLAGWGYNALKKSRKGDLNETAPRWERLRTRSSPHGLNNSRPPLRGPGSTPAWNQGDPPCEFPPGPPGPRQGWAAGLDRFWLLELRVSQHFSTFYGPSVQAMDTQLGRPRKKVELASKRAGFAAAPCSLRGRIDWILGGPEVFFQGDCSPVRWE
jgi:hypothetical protein